jgi:DNA-binding PadR family transcriptional regulator
MAKKKTSRAAVADLLPLPSTTFYILLALTDGERHGYAIMKDVATVTDGAVHLGPGTLYGTLKRLLDAGVVEELEREDPEIGDERRRYYRLSDYGLALARAEARRLGDMVRAAQSRKLIRANLV